jgi:hypothetical protein
MTQNTTKNDKREQCDTKQNALKIYLTRKIYSVSYPVPPAHAPASVFVVRLSVCLSVISLLIFLQKIA